MYTFLDKFFFVFHSALIVFNLFGWIWRKTRVANLVVVLLTVLSWTILGIWYGFGFCPSTEWHWQVRAKLGHYDMPSSYTKFLVDSLTGLDVNEKLVDIFAVLFLTLALFASVLTNMRDWRKKH
ncbi:hypothetical protein LCGC14_0835330 [marine sediment metagenome]|uniref:DUF2784 domain-containing protein n=1 Tax=marine sediment metagenome TaxID=412755 RepID=A0A0F9RZG8_9ZZZZ|nr:DUF2784 family protein [Candidatus Aminicenantes bacterium]HEB35266.1 DUF2784 family protein [Candidatus Aminicenantes bacterium]